MVVMRANTLPCGMASARVNHDRHGRQGEVRAWMNANVAAPVETPANRLVSAAVCLSLLAPN